MKINNFTGVIAILLSALVTYAIYAMSRDGEEHLATLLLTSFLTVSTTLLGLLSVSLPNNRQSVNFKILSLSFAVVFVIEHIVISLTGVNLNTLIILTGILYLIYLLAAYLICNMSM